MLENEKYTTVFVASLSSISALAVRTDCPSAKVVHFQIEGTKIMYLQ